MKRFIEIILDREYFSRQTASDFIHAIGEEQISSEEIAAILTGIQFRGVSPEELEGFRKALLERAIRPELDTTNAIDLCGTGGDGKDTFNISTTSSLVLAAMGYKVIKHGNYGVSSTCGSSNVLEMLGFSFETENSGLNVQLEKLNVCFLHAPLFHPTLKNAAPVRKRLGVRTIFNALGPLVNPVQPPFQLTGTYSLELAKMYQYLLRPHRNNFHVVYGMDGYDEISLTDNARILNATEDRVLTAEELLIHRVASTELYSGGSVKSAASMVVSILKGSGTKVQHQVVAINVALARKTIDPSLQLTECFQDSLQFIQSGQAAKHFKF